MGTEFYRPVAHATATASLSPEDLRDLRDACTAQLKATGNAGRAIPETDLVNAAKRHARRGKR